MLAGIALHKKDAERSLQDIETTLLVCAQQCALDDEEEVRVLQLVRYLVGTPALLQVHPV